MHILPPALITINDVKAPTTGYQGVDSLAHVDSTESVPSLDRLLAGLVVLGCVPLGKEICDPLWNLDASPTAGSSS